MLAVCLCSTPHRLYRTQEMLRTQPPLAQLEEQITGCMERAMQELRRTRHGSTEEGEMDGDEDGDGDEDEDEAQLLRDALSTELEAWLVDTITVVPPADRTCTALTASPPAQTGRCRAADARSCIQLAARLAAKGTPALRPRASLSAVPHPLTSALFPQGLRRRTCASPCSPITPKWRASTMSSTCSASQRT